MKANLLHRSYVKFNILCFIKQRARNNFCVSGDIHVTWLKTVLKHEGAVDTHVWGYMSRLAMFQGSTTGFKRHKNCLSQAAKVQCPMSTRWRIISRMIFSINPKASHRLTSTSFCCRRSLKIKPRMRFAKRKRFVTMPYSRCAILCKKIQELWWLDWTESSCCGSYDFASLAYRWQWKH